MWCSLVRASSAVPFGISSLTSSTSSVGSSLAPVSAGSSSGGFGAGADLSAAVFPAFADDPFRKQRRKWGVVVGWGQALRPALASALVTSEDNLIQIRKFVSPYHPRCVPRMHGRIGPATSGRR